MAFKGTHEIRKNGEKHLVHDFCTSDFNLNKSKWVDPTYQQGETNTLLERMGKDYNLEVKGMNVYLKWETGSDLDINVMCGCGTWHGFGTYERNCICKKCDMKRDHDVKCGEDGRQDAFEHVYFKDPKIMIGKTIGMAVQNFTQNSSLPRNDFKIALINQHGYQLFPNKGSREIQHDPTWMYTGNWSGKGFFNSEGYTS